MMVLQYMEDDQLFDLLIALQDLASSSNWSSRHGAVLILSSFFRHNPSKLIVSPKFPSIVLILKNALKEDKVWQHNFKRFDSNPVFHITNF